MRYLVPFSIFKAWVQNYALPDGAGFDLPLTSFLAMVRRYMEPVRVDEAWYRATHPGIAQAIDRGIFRSAFHHFLAHGYFENRAPFAPDRSDLRQPVSFNELRASTTVRPMRDGLHVLATWDQLIGILQLLLRGVPVDEAWYRKAYQGAEDGIRSGAYISAADHFGRHGYQDGNWPFDMPVDEAWYLGRYRDAAGAVAHGHAASARDHFWRRGYVEGRFPTRAPVMDSAPDHAATA